MPRVVVVTAVPNFATLTAAGAIFAANPPKRNLKALNLRIIKPKPTNIGPVETKIDVNIFPRGPILLTKSATHSFAVRNHPTTVDIDWARVSVASANLSVGVCMLAASP